MDEARSESIWRAVSRLFLLVAVLLLAGCQTVLPSPSEPPTPHPTPEPVSNELPREFEGSGLGSTEDFALGSGRYAIDWSLTSVPGYPCRHWVILRNDNTDHHAETVLDMFTGGDERIYDTTYAWDLPPGRYHFDVNSTCDDWTLLIHEDDEPSQ